METEEMIIERKNKIVGLIESSEYHPMNKSEIAAAMSVPSEDLHLFNRLMDDLVLEGSIIETKKHKYISIARANMVKGIFRSNFRGFGFVEEDDNTKEDIFIPANRTNGAMHKDVVLCKVNTSEHDGKRREGEIVRVVKKGMADIVGTFQKGNGFGFVIPDEKRIAQDIFIPKDKSKGAVTGHKVVVKITKRSEDDKKPEGEIIEILGHINDPGVDILSVIRQYNLPVEFPQEVYDEVENIGDSVEPSEMEGRTDYRKLVTFTIDGEDAKDLDDAVSLEILENGNYLLGVHIADVSNYVKENSELDKEAVKRGTSVYLVDRVIPMLPHKLSNGICSLNPNEDRLTLSCMMEINKEGDVVAHKIEKSVIHSKKRMTYTAVEEIITRSNDETVKEYGYLVGYIDKMNELRIILNNKRKKRGSVNFDLPESKIILDENGKPVEIKPYDSNEATNLIEEFMLICNETVAEDSFWQELPFVYRTHEAPDEEKSQVMCDIIREFGYTIKGKKEIKPKAISQVLEKAKGTPEEHILGRIILRSMKQARYMPDNLGHFGLAAKYYCHFTSPIRRYPDLQIHRIIKENLSGGLTEKRQRYLDKRVIEISNLSSERERVADDAERDTDKLKMVEYMQDHLGEVFEGIISSLTNWGIYVELPNTVEGMIALSDLKDDFYVFNAEKLVCVGEKRGKTYRMGEKVFVKAVKADKEMRTIDFEFADEKEIPENM